MEDNQEHLQDQSEALSFLAGISHEPTSHNDTARAIQKAQNILMKQLPEHRLKPHDLVLDFPTESSAFLDSGDNQDLEYDGVGVERTDVRNMAIIPQGRRGKQKAQSEEPKVYKPDSCNKIKFSKIQNLTFFVVCGFSV